MKQVGNVFLTFGCKRLLVPGASSKGNDNDFAFSCGLPLRAQGGLTPAEQCPKATPAAPRRKSRLLRLKPAAISWLGAKRSPRVCIRSLVCE